MVRINMLLTVDQRLFHINATKLFHKQLLFNVLGVFNKPLRSSHLTLVVKELVLKLPGGYFFLSCSNLTPSCVFSGLSLPLQRIVYANLYEPKLPKG